jgi:hypothetical protein
LRQIEVAQAALIGRLSRIRTVMIWRRHAQPPAARTAFLALLRSRLQAGGQRLVAQGKAKGR